MSFNANYLINVKIYFTSYEKIDITGNFGSIVSDVAGPAFFISAMHVFTYILWW